MTIEELLTVFKYFGIFGCGAIFAAVVGFWFFKSYVPSYFSEKGKNLATKEDVEGITRKVEGVKAELSSLGAVEEQRRKLRHEACIDALSVIDAHFAQLYKSENPAPAPQPISTQKAREAHSKLILSCKDIRIVEKFCEIFFGPEAEKPKKVPTDLLNEFRNLIRAELGFGEALLLDRNRAWVGLAAGDPASINEERA